MDFLLNFFEGFINLGAVVLLPVVIFILGLFFRMSLGKAAKAGMMIGIGFQGLVMTINLLITTIKPVMEYYAALGSGYDTLEIGFAALGAASWTTPFAVFAIPAIVIINLILVRTKITKVLNVDVWNYMHFLVPGALTYALFGSAIAGFLVTVALSIVTLFASQKIAKGWGSFFGLEGTTCTCLSFVVLAYPVSWVVNKIVDAIPGLKDVDLDLSKVESKIGIFGDPIFIGMFVGVFLGIITKQAPTTTLMIMMGIAAVMALLPRMVSIMMEGLTPLGDAANAYMKRSLGEDSSLYIGMDIALGLGDPACITATAIMIPVTIILVFLVPDMRFFPMGLLGEICYLAPMCVLASRGNIFRTLICMTFIMYFTLFFANMFTPEATQMMSVTGVHFDGNVTASHFGWNPGNLVVSIVHRLFF